MSNPENRGTVPKPNGAATKRSAGGGTGGAGVNITLNKGYIMSIPGILKMVEFFILLIAFAIAADINYGNWGRMSLFLFVTITSWLLVIAVFVLFAFNLNSKINLSINWDIPVLVFAVVVAFLLLISSSLLADNAETWKKLSFSFTSILDRLRAAAAFGFMAMFVFIGDAAVQILKITGKMSVQNAS